MLFNSLEFALFFPIVFLAYWFLFNKNLKLQNFLLLVSSYFFYACWDWRFLFLLVFSTLLDFFSGQIISKSPNHKVKTFWFGLSVFVNLGLLIVFKYYNFFIESFTTVLSNFGLETNFWTIKLILPIGISFYTFHGLSYVIDVYKGKIEAEKDFINYSVFVCFFPLLVAGPIERATHLLPQIKRKRTFDYNRFVDGSRQILWGLFKKIVIADRCAEFANIIFDNPTDYSGITLFLGALFFAFQIYGDFSGYSDIALGVARLLGIELLRNFSFPYFSRDIAEFWRRWHISLSSWFRDYLYIPLGGSKGSVIVKVRNVFIIFLVSGLWHGANWTFVTWGLLNALYIMPSIFFNTNRNNLDIVAKNRILPSFKEAIQISTTFILTVFAWIFFRSETISGAFSFVGQIASNILTKASYIEAYNWLIWKVGVFLPILILFFFIIEWLGREQNHALANIEAKSNWVTRHLLYYVLICFILFCAGKEQQFIYFQF